MRTAVCLLALAGCLGGPTIAEYPRPPGGTTLTYDNFGAEFIVRYCARCHSGRAAERNGAPQNYTFDDRHQVYAVRDRIFSNAAADNRAMPPGPNDPPAAAR